MKIFTRGMRLELLSGLCFGFVMGYVTGLMGIMLAVGIALGILFTMLVPFLEGKIYFFPVALLFILAVAVALKQGGII